jgi:tRNA G10  N-methylase Trm11
MKVAGCDKNGKYFGTEQKDYASSKASKPSEAKKRILESMSKVYETELSDCGCGAGFKSGIVLDPFMGSGTTAIVARRLRRSWLGIELSPEYIEIAIARLRNANQKTLKVLEDKGQKKLLK